MINILRWQLRLFIGLSTLIYLFSFGSASAQTLPPCRNIVAPQSYFVGGPSSVIQTKPITDCLDPFSVTIDPVSPYMLKINGEVVADGGTKAVAEGITKDITYEGSSHLGSGEDFLFKHEGEDFVFFDRSASEPVLVDYQNFASTYFQTTAEADLYLMIFEEDQNTGSTEQYFYDENFAEIIDVNTGESVYNRYYSFVDSANNYLYNQTPYITAGTYTLVIRETDIVLSQKPANSILSQIKNLILPTANAQVARGPYVYTLTFTITEVPPEPTGASSVLFLPGIQASRLYKDLPFSNEADQLWEPNANNDVQQLEMTETGFSVNDIYTKDVIDEVYGLGGNIYKGFLEMLEDMEEDAVIVDSLAFAYDWRFDVQDIIYSGTLYKTGIKSLVEEVENLAEDSYTGKVTVIGHSNGGLLAKVLINELERLGKEDLVDKMVFVGVPQLGTPKAIGVLLHGLDQQKLGGVIIGDSTTREVIKNMPGVYNLLPSQKYFDVSGDVLVTTDGSSATTKVTQYGDINSLSKLTDFVLDSQDLRNDNVPINEPSTLNQYLMQNMLSRRDALDNWLAPQGIEVYEIVGKGIATIKGFEYKALPCFSGTCLLEGSKYMKAYPLISNEGDETVMAISAQAYAGTKVTVEVDLDSEGDGVLTLGRKHADMTESPTVQTFLDSVIRFPYLNETLEVPEEFTEVSREYTLIGVHSPVDVSILTSTGKRIGIFENVIREEVAGSQYFELGGSKYLVVPKEIEYELTISGNDTGVYSLTIDLLDSDNIQSSEYRYLGASTSPQMIAKFSASSTGFGTLKTDVDGDGDADIEQTLDGELVVVLPNYTYSSLIAEIKLLQLTKLQKSLLLLQVQIAERLEKQSKTQLEFLTLRNLESTFKLYERKRLITSIQYKNLLKIINYLRT